MVTWDGDQVLQLLLQVHDVVAELDVIHPRERGHHRTTGYIDRTFYILSTTQLQAKRTGGRALSSVKITQAL